MSDSTRVGLFLAALFAASAIMSAYLPLWMADRGLSASAIGTVLGAASLCRVVAVPAWGWIADRVGRPRIMLLAASACAAGCAAGLAGSVGIAAVSALIIVGGIAASALAPLTDAL